jgi:hypothetical protein
MTGGSRLGRYQRLLPEGPGRSECACEADAPCLAHFGMLDLQGQIDARRQVGIDKGDSSKGSPRPRRGSRSGADHGQGYEKKDVPASGRF